MNYRDVIVIGAGQAGLAMSYCLTQKSIDHVVFERGRLAERWQSERWDSLNLLTPNWQSRLPGFGYRGPDPDGYMSMAEVTGYLTSYANSFSAPVHTVTTVLRVAPTDQGYDVETNRGSWRTRCVVIATGHCDVPFTPTMASGIDPRIVQLSPSQYRRPAQLPPGGVLVVGAGASGVQLAHELQLSGRQVTLSVGQHTRVPRVYRGRDILWWMDQAGILDERASELPNIAASRRQPSMQLVGRGDRKTIDLKSLSSIGVRIVGRATAARDSEVALANDLQDSCSSADVRLRRLLSRIDDHIRKMQDKAEQPPLEILEPYRPSPSPTRVQLRHEKIDTIIWATGFVRNYSFLHVPVLNRQGEVTHRDGVTPSPGLYALGLFLMRKRKSTFIDGVGDDAAVIANHIQNHLSHLNSKAA